MSEADPSPCSDQHVKYLPQMEQLEQRRCDISITTAVREGTGDSFHLQMEKLTLWT